MILDLCTELAGNLIRKQKLSTNKEIQVHNNTIIYTPAVVIVETCWPLVLVTTLSLVVKHSVTLTVVTGLVVV